LGQKVRIGGLYMDDVTFLIYFVLITLLSVLSTIIISVKSETKKIYKYIPSIVVLTGSIIYCIIATVLNNSRYIGILYTGVFMIVIPAVSLSLITALAFDIFRLINKKRKRGNDV
jgi:hypothetical protein